MTHISHRLKEKIYIYMKSSLKEKRKKKKENHIHIYDISGFCPYLDESG
jgi:hypothetical protein